MPIKPLFHPFQSLIEECFTEAKADAVAAVIAVDLQIEEEPHNFGARRAEFLVLDPTGPVRITWNGIASLWAFAQAAARLGRRMFEGKRRGDQRLMVDDDPEIQRGLQSLELARRFLTMDVPALAASATHWPQWAPQINAMPLKNSDDEIGNRLFLGALGLILRHELAHVVLDHASRQKMGRLTTRESETEADIQAARWLRASLQTDSGRLVGTKPGEKELQLEWRAISVGLGLIWVALFEADLSQPNNDYPPVAERLFACLHELGLREDSFAAEFLSDIIQVWIAPQETWMPSGGYSTAQEALNDAVYRLHRYLGSVTA
jgi:hypothetical protein